MTDRKDSCVRFSAHPVRDLVLGFLLLAGGVSEQVLTVGSAWAGSGTFVGGAGGRSSGSGVSVEARKQLEAHGRFLKHRVWGDIWRPRQAGDWRPFTVGRWTRDTSGSLRWISNEPFGDTVYRFGRWSFDDALQWIWVPGSRKSPAWVTWRKGKKVVGWAPVAPVRPADARSHVKTSAKRRAVKIPRQAWVFVPRGKLLARDLSAKIMPATWNKTLIAATRVGLPDVATGQAETRVAHARRDRDNGTPDWPDRSRLGRDVPGKARDDTLAEHNGVREREPEWFEDDVEGLEQAQRHAQDGRRDFASPERTHDRSSRPLDDEGRDLHDTYASQDGLDREALDYSYGGIEDERWDRRRRHWRGRRGVGPHDFRFRRGWRARALSHRHRNYERLCDRENGVAADLDDGYYGYAEPTTAERGGGYKDRTSSRDRGAYDGVDRDIERFDGGRWRSAHGEW